MVRRHPQALDDSLRRAAAPARITRAADPHDVGGLSGGWCVRHTWTRPVASHPPVHGLVPAGGVSAERTAWRPARPSSVVPVHARSKRWRGLFRALVQPARPDRRMPESVWTRGGVVSGTPAGPGPEPIRQDLGREVHRVAWTTHRRRAIAANHGSCRDQDAHDQRWTTMTWPAHACRRRVRQQVWPQGCPNVRDDGLWRPVRRPRRPQRQRGLAGDAAEPPPPSPAPVPPATDAWGPPCRAGPRCPSCGPGWRVVIRLLPRHPRGPPCATEPPCGLPLPAASGPRVPATATPDHPCALLPDLRAGSPRPPRPATRASPPVSGSSPRCPPRWSTAPPFINARMCFPSDAGGPKIPSGLALRFRSTTLWCRRRATKTLIRSAAPADYQGECMSLVDQFNTLDLAAIDGFITGLQ